MMCEYQLQLFKETRSGGANQTVRQKRQKSVFMNTHVHPTNVVAHSSSRILLPQSMEPTQNHPSSQPANEK